MSAEPVQLKMEDFTNIVMNVNVVSNNLGVIVKSVTDVLYQIMTSVQVKPKPSLKIESVNKAFLF